jgi:hypothetical protein
MSAGAAPFLFPLGLVSARLCACWVPIACCRGSARQGRAGAHRVPRRPQRAGAASGPHAQGAQLRRGGMCALWTVRAGRCHRRLLGASPHVVPKAGGPQPQPQSQWRVTPPLQRPPCLRCRCPAGRPPQPPPPHCPSTSCPPSRPSTHVSSRPSIYCRLWSNQCPARSLGAWRYARYHSLVACPSAGAAGPPSSCQDGRKGTHCSQATCPPPSRPWRSFWRCSSGCPQQRRRPLRRNLCTVQWPAHARPGCRQRVRTTQPAAPSLCRRRGTAAATSALTQCAARRGRRRRAAAPWAPRATSLGRTPLNACLPAAAPRYVLVVHPLPPRPSGRGVGAILPTAVP